MPRPAAHRIVTLLLAGIGGAPLLEAQSTIRLGGEFQVNRYTTGSQRTPSVVVGADGSFVAAWHSNLQDGSGYGVFARRFDSAGAPLAAEFQVNTYTTGTQKYPNLAMGGGGSFVVAWKSDGQDGNSYGVFARRFDAGGVPQAVEFQVNSATAFSQTSLAVASESNGDFVVVWHSYLSDFSKNIFARRFNAAGTPLSAEFLVNTYTTGDQTSPAVAMDADGDFVLAWTSTGQDGNLDGVFGRLFNSAGTPLFVEFQINAYATSAQNEIDLAMDTDGDFVAAWQSFHDGAGFGVFGRRFNFTGTPQGVEFQINTYTSDDQDLPAVAIDSSGDFVVTWESTGQDGALEGIFGRRFAASGTPLETEFQASTYVTGAQRVPAAAMNASGDFVLAWSSDNAQDGSSSGIFAQRFETIAILDIDGNGSTAALTDGLLVLRFLFGFTGSTLVGGAVDAVDCTRCDATAIAGYLETLI